MTEWRDVVMSFSAELMLLLFVMQVVLLFLLIVTWVRFRNIRKQHKKLLRGINKGNLEQIIAHYTKTAKSLEKQLDEAAIHLDAMNRQLKHMKGRIGLVRYNALSEQGSELSFSLAMLDNDQNGVVISSLFGSNQSYVYAKPIIKGKSTYNLSKEEEQAIERAMGAKEVLIQ